MIPVRIRVHHAQGHADEIALHKLVLHAERVLLAGQERLEVRATDGQWEGSEIFRLLILSPHGHMQFQGRAVPVPDIHLQRESPPVLVGRGRHVCGRPIVLVDPGIHENLPGGDLA